MRSRIKAIIRPLDPADPRSWDHPSHEQAWLELAKEIGRQIARDEREARRIGPHIIEGTDGGNEDGGNLC